MVQRPLSIAALIPALLSPLALAGCGSALTDASALGDDQRPLPYTGTIALTSEPPGARCVLTNTASGNPVASVATPATITLPRGTAIIETICTAPASMPTIAMIRPVRDFAADIHHPMPVGTGIAQNAAVVASGSTRRYDDTVVNLPPQPFASATVRDAWFAEQAARIRQAAAPGIARAQRSPQATIDTPETLIRYRDEDLARLEAQKAQATIASALAAR